jgi:hypothetical protein
MEFDERIRQLEVRTRALERHVRCWRLSASGLVIGCLLYVGLNSEGRFADEARAEQAQKPGAQPGAKPDAERIPPEAVWRSQTGKLTLIQDTTRPEPGGGRHAEALAIVTDGHGIPFCFYERAPDGTVFPFPSTYIGNGGDFCTRKFVTISGTCTPPDKGNYYCIPPSNDPAMLTVWQDVANSIQTRGPSENEAFTVIRNETGTYCLSIGNDGALRWGSGTAVSKWPKEPGNTKVRAALPDFLRYNPTARCLETNMDVRKVDR